MENLDFLGNVCVRINRDKPLSDCIEVSLGESAPDGALPIGGLFLDSLGESLVFRQMMKSVRIEAIIS